MARSVPALAASMAWAGLVALAPAPATAASPGGPVAAAPLRVQPADIIDRQGFGQALRAYSLMLPAGFRPDGEVAWNLRMGGCERPFHVRLQARSADGAQQIALLPGEGWGRSSFGALAPGCPVSGIATAEAYLRQWVQQHRPGARWQGWQPRAGGVPAPMEMDMGGGARMRRWTEAGRATIAYPHEGRPVQEILAVVVGFGDTMLPPLPGQAPIRTLSGESGGILAWRAPEGRLDPRHFDAVWATLRSDPDWAARVQQGMNAIAQDNARTQAQISQINAETSRQTLQAMAERGEAARRSREEVAAIRDAGVRDTAATGERMHRRAERAIRGVEPYRDPAGGAVELPNHYAHAWKLKDGSYVLTDSADFRPARDLGIEGQALKRLPD